ncbi:hypothetical protein ACROYT_G030583 [Oculina patagonica]
MAYRASTLRGLAVAQMVFGALMIVFGVACIFSAYHWSSHVGFGVWVGCWVFINGILGYVGARDDSKPNNCLIGCYMGFSIFACVIAGVMFICYCVTLADYSKLKHCQAKYFYNDNWPYRSYDYCHDKYHMKRDTAANVAGLGSCLLIFSIVEFFLAIAASIYCCAAVCCGTSSGAGTSTATNQQVMYVQPQYMYPGAQGGMVLIQPSGAVSAMPQGYPVAGQQAIYIPTSQGGVPMQQPVFMAVPPGSNPAGAVPVSGAAGAQGGVPMQQPVFMAVPSGSNPAGTVTVSYAGAAGAQVQLPKEYERPPPYSYAQTDNAPPSAPAHGTPSVDV